MTRIILVLLSMLCIGCFQEESLGKRGSETTLGGGQAGYFTEPNDAGTSFFEGTFAETCGTSDRQWEQGKTYYEPLFPYGWEPTCFFPSIVSHEGRYLSEQFDPFEITVDAPGLQAYDRLTPYEVAELAYWMTAIHALMDLPCATERTPYEWLSKGHFVVVSDTEVFAQLREQDDANNLGAFISGNPAGVCWESPEGVYWTSIIRSRNWGRQGVGIVVHEMIHIMSLAVNGHSDPGHEDPRLWVGAGGEASLGALVIKTHDCTYFPNRCDNSDDVGVSQ